MNDNENTPLEVLPPSAIMAMEKASIDQQIATAHQYPRSLELFKKRALSMATLDPDTADSCIYCRPVGKELNKATGKWEEKFAEGPSIRLAEIVAVSYGNLRAAARVVEQTERYVKCQGMAHDLESNTAMSADVIESTVNKEGAPYSERQRALTAKVCTAKALRDSILKVVPRALCKPILEAAKKVAAGADQPLEVRRKKAQAWISTLKIEEARVFAALSVQGWSDVTTDHLLILTGLKTAMSEGDETIDSAFPPLPGSHQAQAQGKAPQNLGPQNGGQKPPTDSKLDTSKAATTQPAKTEQAKNEPKTEKEAAKTADPAPKEEAKEPPKTVQEPSKAAEATQTRSEAEKPQAEPAAASQEPSGAPAQEEQAPATAVGGDDLPEFIAPRKDDTDAVASIKLLCAKAGVSGRMLRNWLESKKLIRGEQRQLSELASTKLDALNRTFPQKVAEMKALGAK